MKALLTTNVIVVSLLAILALVVLDVLSKIAVSIAKGKFEWGKVLCFLRTNVVPYVIAYGGVQGLLYAAGYLGFPEAVVAPFVGITGLVYLLIVGRLIASILGNFKELGIPTEMPMLKE
jgi:hypothetical protein